MAIEDFITILLTTVLVSITGYYATIDDADDIEFHHIKPFSEDGPTDPANIGAVCKDHHRRIRTLSLSEFRDHLAMDRFFADAVPRRLDDLLRLKLAADGFGRAVRVDELRDGQLTLRFTRPERTAQTCAIFACPATGMRYFYSVLPIEYLANDGDLQPRPLEQKRIWELYRHLSAPAAPATRSLRMGRFVNTGRQGWGQSVLQSANLGR